MLNVMSTLFAEDMNNIFESRKSWEELRNSKFFITGANGMLASYFVSFLVWLNVEKGYNIEIVINTRSIEKSKKVFGKFIDEKWFNVIEGDICLIDYNENDILRDVDYVVHAASFASARFFGKYPVETILPNVVATNKLLDYYREKKVRRILFLSSTAVYGDTVLGTPINEESPSCINLTTPGNYYGISKYCGETICKAYAGEYKVPVVMVRIAHSYGPTMDITHDVRVFSEFVKNIINRENIVIKGDGTDCRMFCYASDCISGILIALLDGEIGESYNLANPSQLLSIKELAEIMVSIWPDYNLKVEYSERSGLYSPSNFNSSFIVDVTKLKNLGWDHKIDAREGFKRTIQMIDNRE